MPKKNSDCGNLAYLPYGYGVCHSHDLSTLTYNGERYDKLSGCYPLGAGHRLFSVTLMRFISPDTLSPFLAGGNNCYSYCEGDPVNYQDPTGQMRVALSSLNNRTRPAVPPLTRRIVRRQISKLNTAIGHTRTQISNASKAVITNGEKFRELLMLSSTQLTPELKAQHMKTARLHESLEKRASELLKNLTTALAHQRNQLTSKQYLLDHNNRENLPIARDIARTATT